MVRFVLLVCLLFVFASCQPTDPGGDMSYYVDLHPDGIVSLDGTWYPSTVGSPPPSTVLEGLQPDVDDGQGGFLGGYAYMMNSEHGVNSGVFTLTDPPAGDAGGVITGVTVYFNMQDVHYYNKPYGPTLLGVQVYWGADVIVEFQNIPHAFWFNEQESIAEAHAAITGGGLTVGDLSNARLKIEVNTSNATTGIFLWYGTRVRVHYVPPGVQIELAHASLSKEHAHVATLPKALELTAVLTPRGLSQSLARTAAFVERFGFSVPPSMPPALSLSQRFAGTLPAVELPGLSFSQAFSAPLPEASFSSLSFRQRFW